MSTRPNIVLVLCDDLGFGDIGVLFQNQRHDRPDRPSLHTPHLDRMASEGLILEGMYCPAPVCAPSRASLLTGVTQGHATLRNNAFDQELEDADNLATVLREAGYATAAIGKWGLQGEPQAEEELPGAWPGYPTRRGFDEFFGYVRHMDGHEHYPKEGLYRGRKEVWHNDQEVSADLDGCYTTDLFTARAKQWITEVARREDDQPFFLYLALDTPHAVTELPAAPYPPGAGVDGGLQWLGRPGHMINTASGEPDSYLHPDYAAATSMVNGTPEPWPNIYRRYATVVRRIDDCVGDLLQLLADLAIDDNTLVIFTSDNGPSIESYLPEQLDADFFESYGPFEGIKRDCWEGGLRVGALVRGPGHVPGGRVSSAPVQFQDVLPTCAELAGVAPPARTDGVSLLPLWTGESDPRPSTIYTEYRFAGRTPDYPGFARHRRGRLRGEMQMIRIGDHVGVRYDIRDADDPFEIYHILDDPKQLDDLAEQRPDLQAELQARVARLRMPHPQVRRPYDEVFAGALAPMATSPGTDHAERKSFSDHYPWLPLLDDLAPTSTSVVSWPIDDTPVSPGTTALMYTGWIEVEADDAYCFEVDSTAPVLLRIHQARVLEASAGTTGAATGTIRLARGRHPFRLYLHGAQAPVVRWAPLGPTPGRDTTTAKP